MTALLLDAAFCLLLGLLLAQNDALHARALMHAQQRRERQLQGVHAGGAFGGYGIYGGYGGYGGLGGYGDVGGYGGGAGLGCGRPDAVSGVYDDQMRLDHSANGRKDGRSGQGGLVEGSKQGGDKHSGHSKQGEHYKKLGFSKPAETLNKPAKPTYPFIHDPHSISHSSSKRIMEAYALETLEAGRRREMCGEAQQGEERGKVEPVENREGRGNGRAEEITRARALERMERGKRLAGKSSEKVSSPDAHLQGEIGRW